MEVIAVAKLAPATSLASEKSGMTISRKYVFSAAIATRSRDPIDATIASARQAVEGAADGLMPAHAELARLDPRSPEAVRETLREIEVQVSMVSERRERVEKRVREVQALLVEQYKRGDADPDDWVR